MPKRNALYMKEQREMIARAALHCILEKGIAATTTREVCTYAGISKGALYTHFKTREDLIVAVLELEAIFDLDPVDNWVDYEKRILSFVDPIGTEEAVRLLMSASYGFLSEILRTKPTLQRLDGEWDATYHFFRESLRLMHERGEITLPLGLEPTIRLHIQIQAGAIYCLLGDQRQEYAQMRVELLQSLGHAAGLKARARRQGELALATSRSGATSVETVALTFPYRKVAPEGSNDPASRPSLGPNEPTQR